MLVKASFMSVNWFSFIFINFFWLESITNLICKSLVSYTSNLSEQEWDNYSLSVSKDSIFLSGISFSCYFSAAYSIIQDIHYVGLRISQPNQTIKSRACWN